MIGGVRKDVVSLGDGGAPGICKSFSFTGADSVDPFLSSNLRKKLERMSTIFSFFEANHDIPFNEASEVQLPQLHGIMGLCCYDTVQ